MHAAAPALKPFFEVVFVQSINQPTVLVFGTHQGSQQTMTRKATYTMHNSMQQRKSSTGSSVYL